MISTPIPHAPNIAPSHRLTSLTVVAEDPAHVIKYRLKALTPNKSWRNTGIKFYLDSGLVEGRQEIYRSIIGMNLQTPNDVLRMEWNVSSLGYKREHRKRPTNNSES